MSWNDLHGQKRLFDSENVNRPYTPMEALLRCAPGDEVDDSVIELIALRDVLNDALDEQLTPLERWVFDGVVVERLSLREAGRLLQRGKTSVARIRDRAIRKLQDHLLQQPAVQARLERNS